jgi:hypothetical protein
MYRCGQSLQGIMYIAFFVCFDAVLSLTLCFMKCDLSLCAGLCATLMLKGRNNLAVISDVLVCKVELFLSLIVQVVRQVCYSVVCYVFLLVFC